jgi:hypothetical protein
MVVYAAGVGGMVWAFLGFAIWGKVQTEASMCSIGEPCFFRTYSETATAFLGLVYRVSHTNLIKKGIVFLVVDVALISLGGWKLLNSSADAEATRSVASFKA